MSTYVVATTERPSITCPSWCVVSQQEHVAELPNWDGKVIHWSSDRELCPGFTARIAASATPAGDLDPDNPPSVHLYPEADLLGFAEAAQAAKALAALMKEANA